ncbi:unnamed protein product [Caenorhabditis brenneri]
MIERLLFEEMDEDVRNLVEYELHQFEATCRIYLQNIKTEDISNMRPLAKYISLSIEFRIEYEKYTGNNYQLFL